MSFLVFEGRRTAAGPRVWQRSKAGRYQLSGPACDALHRQAYEWGEECPGTFCLAIDLLCAIGSPPDLAHALAKGLVRDVLCSLPDEWELTGRQLTHWRDTVPTFAVAILPETWGDQW